MKKVVITGATGFIGLHLIQEFLKSNCEIYTVVRPKGKHTERIPKDEHIHVLPLPMDEYGELPNAIEQADYFYHLAWEGARAPLRDDGTVQKHNYTCAVEAFHAARNLGCSFFLGSGSQAEYGLTCGLIDEAYPCSPITEYGKQKLRACQTIGNLAMESGMNFIWTRIFSIFGPGDYPGTLVMQALEKMSRNEPVEMTQGTQLWDYLFVSDAARAMAAFPSAACCNGVYNIASGEYRPLRTFVEKMKEIIGSNSELHFGAVPYGTGGPVNLTPDPTKVKKALAWQPEVSFEAGIRKIIKQQEQE